MPIIEVGEVRLYYAVYGSGRPLVFLHGAGSNSLVWWQQIDVFARHYQCIFIDARGFGRSVGPLPVPWTDAFVPDLALVLDEVGAAECALVGHSMGGWTATAFCRADPARVKTVVMSASTGGFWPPARQAERPAVRRRGE